MYLCIIKQVKTQVSPTNKLKTNMAKVGYIFLAEAYESVESDKAWMEKFGCVKIVEENAEDEKLRPEWKALLMSLERGDELVLSKFSNALRGTRELSYFLELCRIKVIRIISIHDKVDSKDEVFSALKTSDFLDMIGSLPAEVATLRKASTHIMRLRTAKTKTKSTKSRQEREATIVNMYNGGHAIDDIGLSVVLRAEVPSSGSCANMA